MPGKKYRVNRRMQLVVVILVALVIFAIYSLFHGVRLPVGVKKGPVVAAGTLLSCQGTPSHQMVLSSLDNLKRPGTNQIMLAKSDMPSSNGQAREQLTLNPVGWHQTKINGQFVWQRGHLLGYQFSGLNNEVRNLTAQTAWANAGAVNGSNDRNPASQVFYEDALATWLKAHPSDYLDYTVTPNYNGKDLIPHSNTLSWIGYDSTCKPIQVPAGGNSSASQTANVQTVEVPNVEPGVNINYATGEAKAA